MSAELWIAGAGLAITVFGGFGGLVLRGGKLTARVATLERRADSTKNWRTATGDQVARLTALHDDVTELKDLSRTQQKTTQDALRGISDSISRLSVDVGRLQAFREASREHRAADSRADA